MNGGRVLLGWQRAQKRNKNHWRRNEWAYRETAVFYIERRLRRRRVLADGGVPGATGRDCNDDGGVRVPWVAGVTTTTTTAAAPRRGTVQNQYGGRSTPAAHCGREGCADLIRQTIAATPVPGTTERLGKQIRQRRRRHEFPDARPSILNR